MQNRERKWEILDKTNINIFINIVLFQKGTPIGQVRKIRLADYIFNRVVKRKIPISIDPRVSLLKDDLYQATSKYRQGIS